MSVLSHGAEEIVMRGDASLDNAEGFTLFYLKEGMLIAADCVSRPKEFMVSKQLVKDKVKIPGGVLSDEAIEPAQFIAHAN